jgi:hypothetical protein
MNTYKHPMTSYKSPIKKISNAGSKLASVAAHRGSIIIDTASSVVQNARSPPRGPNVHPQPHDKKPINPQRRSGAGIRDRINKFDSACWQNPSPAPRGAMHAVKSYPVNPNYRPDRKEGDKESTSEEQMDKENAANFTSPSRHRKIKQKLQDTFSPAKENVMQKVHAAFSPVTKHDDEEISVQKVQTVSSQQKKRYNQEVSDRQMNRDVFSPKYDMPDSPPRATKSDEDSELKKRLLQLEQQNEMLEKKNLSLTSKCQELIEENERLASSKSATSQGINTTERREHINEKTKAKKRLSNEHPLISSPLRNHVRAVQEASETNSFISVRKEPFPLFAPEYQCKTSHDDCVDKQMRKKNDHLNDLGVLTGQGRAKKGSIQTDGACNAGEKRSNEEAMDLLNSAAFLFKTSRRRLN